MPYLIRKNIPVLEMMMEPSVKHKLLKAMMEMGLIIFRMHMMTMAKGPPINIQPSRMIMAPIHKPKKPI